MGYAIIITVISLGVAVAWWQWRKSHRQLGSLPEKVKLVSGLLSEISSIRMRITPSRKLKEQHSLNLSLRDVGECMDTDPELSSEQYDECKVLLGESFEKIIDVDKYVSNQLLPAEIANELRYFKNSRYKRVNLPSKKLYFALSPGSAAAAASRDGNLQLLEGNAEAFESWLDFKEHSHSLHYVTRQWLADNSNAGNSQSARVEHHAYN